ncbi:hypothetical protein KUL17_36870 [Alteromonas sp. KUL17]|uniref:hypothetical protein n=1 Tax=Alteromonas sp. KUL17 TaxID=2480796 RepID=UPI001037990C|nr:hypothetical protein [Alteromonas sp. KUL17]TAP20657.1 hypothetical protein KUL49_18395 [Alteromonas sp. KUL17]GEA04790.1 hypothetical protein KUL17_36870 [Alteromonas sp. KUL17]
MTLPKNTPHSFCKAFIQRELDSYRDKHIWMSYWPVMENMIQRADDLSQPFEELVKEYGYMDMLEQAPPNNSYIWLTLEHIWCSIDFRKEDVMQARKDLKELKELQGDIVSLALNLASKLRRQSELYEKSGFSKADYQFIDDLLEQASQNNSLYHFHVAEKIKSLTYQYDLKYWPEISDLVTAIAEFEEEQPDPNHSQYPSNVINGRESDIKDFVLAFDSKFDEFNGLPTNFRFSNGAMADIINVVLELPVEKLATGDAVRIVRNRFKQS